MTVVTKTHWQSAWNGVAAKGVEAVVGGAARRAVVVVAEAAEAAATAAGAAGKCCRCARTMPPRSRRRHGKTAVAPCTSLCRGRLRRAARATAATGASTVAGGGAAEGAAEAERSNRTRTPSWCRSRTGRRPIALAGTARRACRNDGSSCPLPERSSVASSNRHASRRMVGGAAAEEAAVTAAEAVWEARAATEATGRPCGT